MIDTLEPRDFVVDCDDFVDPSQLALFDDIRAARPDFKVTLYAVPNRLGPVWDLAAANPWARFAIHGWEHSQFECLPWTEEVAEERLQAALDMGYAPLFKAPNWLATLEVQVVCARLGIALHVHNTHRGPWPEGLRIFPSPKANGRLFNLHTHLIPNPATEWIREHPGFLPEAFSAARDFFFIDEVALP